MILERKEKKVVTTSVPPCSTSPPISSSACRVDEAIPHPSPVSPSTPECTPSHTLDINSRVGAQGVTLPRTPLRGFHLDTQWVLFRHAHSLVDTPRRSHPDFTPSYTRPAQSLSRRASADTENTPLQTTSASSPTTFTVTHVSLGETNSSPAATTTTIDSRRDEERILGRSNDSRAAGSVGFMKELETKGHFRRECQNSSQSINFTARPLNSTFVRGP